MTDDAPNIGQRLKAAALELTNAQAEMDAAQQQLDLAKQKVIDLEQKLLPALMEEAGSQKWIGDGGLCITVQDIVRTNTKNPALHAWLREIGNGGLIKGAVVVPFNKGSDDDALKFVADLADKQIHATFESDVNWQSLQTLVRDLRKKGTNVPLAELNIHVMPTAKVKLPAKKGAKGDESAEF